MELKEGMYARTKNGEIGKIRTIIDNMAFINTNQYYSTVLKASYNIIDLIELGDLIEVECEKDNTNVFEVVAIDYENNELGIFDNNFNIDFCSIEQIKSIVTKEQFESMSYKVEQ